MVYVAFWLNIISFTFMFGAFGLSYILLKKEKTNYRLSYLQYIGISWIWFVTQFAGFVNFSFLGNEPDVFIYVIEIIRTTVSVGIFIITPILLFNIAFVPIALQEKLIIFAAPSFVVVITIITLIFKLYVIASFISLFLNMSLGMAFLFTRYIIHRKKLENKVATMLPFLWISGIAYNIFALYSLVFIIFPSKHDMRFDAFATGLFITIWCFNDVIVFLKEFNSADSSAVAIPSSFITYFSISPREKEIIEHLMMGLSYKQMGDMLFISPRTVETHVYRIFKKCSVSNKIELINLILSHT